MPSAKNLNNQQDTIMEPTKDTSPDDLIQHFRGRSLKSIILFTIILHVVVIGGTSIPFFIRALTGPNTEAMSEEERIELAFEKASSALRDIAEEHDIRPQKLSDRFGGMARPTAAPTEEEASNEAATTEESTDPEEPIEPEEPKSEIEKELEKAEPGPELPPVEEAVDLFG